MTHRSSLPSSIRGAALLIAFVCLIMLIVVLTPDHDHDDSLPRCTGQRHDGTADVVPAGARPCVLDRTSTIGTPRTGTPTRTTRPTAPAARQPGAPKTPAAPRPAAPKTPAVKQPGKPQAPAARQPGNPKAPAAKPAAPAPKLR